MEKDEKLPISVFIITKDNIRTVKKALSSVADWAGEIVAVDSGSSDGTLEVLSEFTESIHKRDWSGFREQYQFAQGLCKNRWVIFIDADEEVSPKLVEEIRRLFSDGEPEKDGYIVHRRTYFLGRWIRHGGWYPDYEIRLYRKDRGSWKGGLHAKVYLDGEVGELKNFYHHYSYKDISDQIRRVNLYSDTEAGDMSDKKGVPSFMKLIFRPAFRFFRDYFLKLGFLDGIPGLVIAVTTSYYVFIKYAKQWEKRRVTEVSQS